jgi:uncharacterized membrane protein YhaH (DUF805 family)
MTAPLDPSAPAVEPSGPLGWFRGRAGRREYWMQILLLFIISYGLGFVPPAPRLWLTLLLTLMLMFIQVRRVHDLGRSGWWAVAATVVPAVLIVPVMRVASLGVTMVTAIFLELILLLAIGVPPGDADDNLFGPPPPYTFRRVLIGR